MARISFLTFIDLRFLLPPLINLFLYYFLSSQPQDLLLYWVDHYLNSPHSILMIVAIILLSVLAITCMICTSITVPFALTLGNRLSLQLGNFSFPWTAAFIASFVLSPGVFFYFVFPVTLLISLSQELILTLLRRFFGWLFHTLRRFPGVDVICLLNGQYHDEDDTQTPELFELESPEIQVNSAHDQPSSELELEIIADG